MALLIRFWNNEVSRVNSALTDGRSVLSMTAPDFLISLVMLTRAWRERLGT